MGATLGELAAPFVARLMRELAFSLKSVGQATQHAHELTTVAQAEDAGHVGLDRPDAVMGLSDERPASPRQVRLEDAAVAFMRIALDQPPLLELATIAFIVCAVTNARRASSAFDRPVSSSSGCGSTAKASSSAPQGG